MSDSWQSFGNLSNGTNDGLWIVNGNNTLGNANWNIGSRNWNKKHMRHNYHANISGMDVVYPA